MGRVQPTDPATAPTVKLLLQLATERECGDDMRVAIVHELKSNPVQGRCSALIDYLKLCDRTPEARATMDTDAVTEPGYYRYDGQVYQVVRAKAGHLYPVELSTGRFAKGVFPKLRASERATEFDAVLV